MPWLAMTSAKLTPAARTRMRTCPAAGCGSGVSRTSNAAGPPFFVSQTARMKGLLFRLHGRAARHRAGDDLRLALVDVGRDHLDGALLDLDRGHLVRIRVHDALRLEDIEEHALGNPIRRPLVDHHVRAFDREDVRTDAGTGSRAAGELIHVEFARHLYGGLVDERAHARAQELLARIPTGDAVRVPSDAERRADLRALLGDGLKDPPRARFDDARRHAQRHLLALHRRTAETAP